MRMVGWFGGTFGAQIQSGHVVIGIEGDIDWTNIKGSGSGAVSFLGNPGTATVSSSVSSISTLRTRVGYAPTIGCSTELPALPRQKPRPLSPKLLDWFAAVLTRPPALQNLAYTRVSPPALGVEYGITPNMSAKFEWVWIGAGAGNTLYENMMRAGLNYRFGG